MPAQKGERNAAAKLTEDEVRAIRRDPRPGKVVASDYDVSVAHVWRIRNRIKWGHLDAEPSGKAG